MTIEKLLDLLLHHKEFIALIPPAITGIVWLLSKILQYSKASSYSFFYEVPRELFDRGNVIKTVENAIMIFVFMIVFILPAAILDWIDEKYVITVFVCMYTSLYGFVILTFLAKQATLRWGIKWNGLCILTLDVVMSIGITIVFVLAFQEGCDYAVVCLLIAYLIFATCYALVCTRIFLEYNPPLERMKKFSIIDEDEIEKLEINIESKSVLLVVDYLRDNKMIVKECVEKDDSLILKSKFWTISGEGVGISTKEYPNGIKRG